MLGGAEEACWGAKMVCVSGGKHSHLNSPLKRTYLRRGRHDHLLGAVLEVRLGGLLGKIDAWEGGRENMKGKYKYT